MFSSFVSNDYSSKAYIVKKKKIKKKSIFLNNFIGNRNSSGGYLISKLLYGYFVIRYEFFLMLIAAMILIKN